MRLIYLFVVFIGLGQGRLQAADWVEVTLGAKYTTNTEFRSATFYDGYQLSPILFIGLMNNRIHFLVNSLEFNGWITDDIKYRTRLKLISDGILYKTTQPKPTIWRMR